METLSSKKKQKHLINTLYFQMHPFSWRNWHTRAHTHTHTNASVSNIWFSKPSTLYLFSYFHTVPKLELSPHSAHRKEQARSAADDSEAMWLVRELPGRLGLPGPPPGSSDVERRRERGREREIKQKRSKGQKRGGQLRQWSGSSRRKAQKDFPASRLSLGNHQRENYSEIKRI